MFHVCLIFLLLFILFELIICDFWARSAFLSGGYILQYPYLKNLNEARKQYKNNWSLFQRLFWIPVFKEKYKNRIHLLAFSSYIHCVWAFSIYLCLILCDLYFPNSILWGDLKLKVDIGKCFYRATTRGIYPYLP